MSWLGLAANQTMDPALHGARSIASHAVFDPQRLPLRILSQETPRETSSDKNWPTFIQRSATSSTSMAMGLKLAKMMATSLHVLLQRICTLPMSLTRLTMLGSERFFLLRMR